MSRGVVGLELAVCPLVVSPLPQDEPLSPPSALARPAVPCGALPGPTLCLHPPVPLFLPHWCPLGALTEEG